MKLTELSVELGSELIEVFQGDPDKISIRGCSLLEKDDCNLLTETLYYLTDDVLFDDFVLPRDAEGTIFLFKDKQSIPPALLDKKINILLPGEGYLVQQVYNKIQRALGEDPMIERCIQQLMDAHFSDFGLQHLVDTAFELTGRAIYVIDMNYRFLAISSKLKADNLQSPILREEFELGHIVDEGVEFIKKMQLAEVLRRSRRPLYFDNAFIGGGTLLDLVKIHDIEVAKIMMYEGDAPFTKLDRVIISRLAQMISMELRKGSFFKNNRGVVYSYFLADLLEHGVSNYKNLSHRLSLLGFALREKLYIMVVDSIGSKLKNEARFEVVANQLHWNLVGSMYVNYQNRLVMLVSRTGEGITEAEYTRVEEYLAENSLVVGISSHFGDINDINIYYRQALNAAMLGERVFHEPKVYHYKDINLFHMLSICEKETDIINFCSPELLALQRYDRENNSDLTNTLYRFLMRVQSSRAAAQDLNVHKNTLLYRIEKIKEITGCLLEDGNEVARLQMSFLILRYLRQF